jgi:hypothetical protein
MRRVKIKNDFQFGVFGIPHIACVIARDVYRVGFLVVFLLNPSLNLLFILAAAITEFVNISRGFFWTELISVAETAT